MILLFDVSWARVKDAFVRELMTRGARWVYGAHPELNVVRPGERSALTGRVEKS